MTSLKTVLSTTSSYLKELEKIGIFTLEDLLLYFPRTYQNQNKGELFSDLRGDQINNFSATVCTKNSSPTKTGKKLYKVVIQDREGDLAECVWFVRPFFWESLLEGKSYFFIGKAKLSFGKLQITSPKVEFENANSVFSGEILPVYSQSGEKLTPDWFRQKLHSLLPYCQKIPENLPEEILKKEKLIPKSLAVKNLHFPSSQEELEKAKERIAFEELFFLQKNALQKKEELKEKGKEENLSLKMEVNLIKDFFASLPFEPTGAQKVAIFQILKDQEKAYPMSRLLEGDVGSGKTLVILAAALNTIFNGKQTALMAPTEVLARQHFSSVSKMIEVFEEKFPIYKDKFKPALLLGALTPKQKQEVLLKLQNGEVNFLIGTHALITDKVSFENLGLAVIDEQHRFGVEQREKLSAFGATHTLNVTATPIPRTLALVAYGDQEISVLNEMPKGRKTIKTSVVSPSGRGQVYRFVESEIEKGRQAYVICPLVEESEKLDEVKAVTEEYKVLKEIFPKLRIGLMHGRLKSKEKEEVMKKFKEREFEILVSTSVIEVGVDVQNSTLILIEGAERFGLSQLHQFRGRVGRGEHQSYCFLFSTNDQGEISRLKAMEKYADGFSLAEIDMKLRGPGEVYGVRQSGIPDLKMASFSDHKMVLRARSAAEEFLGLKGEV